MSDAPILSGLNHAESFDTATDFEKKHTPFVSAERADGAVLVTVEVGHWVAHPNQPDHFIEWIQVYANDLPVARFDLSAVVVAPRVTCVLDVDAGTKITAVSSCNLHGLWISDAVLA